MGEWPDHPRLTDALRRLADDAETSEDHRQAVLARLLQDSPTTSERTRRRGRTRPKMISTARPRPPIAVVAIAAAVVVSGLAFANLSRPAIETTIEATGSAGATSQPIAAPEDSDSATTQVPDQSPPELIPANSCKPRPADFSETEFLVTIDDQRSITVGAQVVKGTGMAPGALGLIDFGDTPDWRTGRQLDVLDLSLVWTAYRVPDVADATTAMEVINKILANTCQSAVFAALPPNMAPAGTAVSCRILERGPTLNGVLLIEPEQPPATCPGLTPTLVARSNLREDAIDAWASAYGCLGSSREQLVGDATIVTFADCRHRVALVDLQRPIEDLWTDTGLARTIVTQLLQLR